MTRLFSGRGIEFFEDDVTLRLSTNRLATNVAVFTTAALAIFFAGCAAKFSAPPSSTPGMLPDTRMSQYLEACVEMSMIIAGLGGFNYAAGRIGSAYTQVRLAQAEKGLMPQVAAQAPVAAQTIINTGTPAAAATEKIKDANIVAEGDVNVVDRP